MGKHKRNVKFSKPEPKVNLALHSHMKLGDKPNSGLMDGIDGDSSDEDERSSADDYSDDSGDSSVESYKEEESDDAPSIVDAHKPTTISGSEGEDSDEETQRAFTDGRLSLDAINVEMPPSEKKRFIVNNVEGLESKLTDIERKLEWPEVLVLTNGPSSSFSPGQIPHSDTTASSSTSAQLLSFDPFSADDDIKREKHFMSQGQMAVVTGIPKLLSLGLEVITKTKRPADYYAEMAKTDVHMAKIRDKLLSKRGNALASERAKAMRAAASKKDGIGAKKIQQEAILRRAKEKREILETINSFKRRKANEELEATAKLKTAIEGKKDKKKGLGTRGNKKREYKNKKFGYGGQKKRSKSNTKESYADIGGKKKGGGRGKKTFGDKKNHRPGKINRRRARTN